GRARSVSGRSFLSGSGRFAEVACRCRSARPYPFFQLRLWQCGPLGVRARLVLVRGGLALLDVGLQGSPQFFVASHDSPRLCTARTSGFGSCLKAFTVRWSLDLTVPAGSPSVSVISLWDISPKSDIVKIVRSSALSRLNAWAIPRSLAAWVASIMFTSSSAKSSSSSRWAPLMVASASLRRRLASIRLRFIAIPNSHGRADALVGSNPSRWEKATRKVSEARSPPVSCPQCAVKNLYNGV